MKTMSKKGYLYDGTRCIACRGCQVACKQWNQLPAEKTTFFAQDGGYQNPPGLTANTWNLIEFKEKGGRDDMEWLFRRRSCNHCTDAACIEACPVEPVKAMTRHPEYGTVYVNQELCIGCGSCVEACPFGIPQLDEDLAKSFKCRACLDRVESGKVTACATTCPTGAVAFGSRDRLAKKAKERLEELRNNGEKAFIYGLKELDGLGVIYILPGELGNYNLPGSPQVTANIKEVEKLIKPYKKQGKLTASVVKEAWSQVKKRSA
jgi:formate dehydrogenase iron-sulfur subunit